MYKNTDVLTTSADFIFTCSFVSGVYFSSCSAFSVFVSCFLPVSSSSVDIPNNSHSGTILSKSGVV